MSYLNIIEACLMKNYDDKWIINSRATNYICYSLQSFNEISLPVEEQKYLTFGNEELVSTKVIGSVSLYFNNSRMLFLHDYLFVPNIKKNLISINCLINNDLTFQFNSSI